MSFGFSVGDFLAISRLIAHITSSLKASGGSASDYQELQLELLGLQLVLHKVEHLKGSPTQGPAINGIKVAALNCQFVLESFAEKLKKYECSLEYGHSRGWVVDTAKKIKWEMAMKREVQDLRAYLLAHTSTLNMRISTEGLATSTMVLEQVENSRISLERRLENVQDAVVDVQATVDAQNISLLGNVSVLQRIFQILSSDIVPRLDSILGLVSKVWSNNMRIMSWILNEQIRLPAPDLQHAWAQAPVRFEDALGRLLPIPSEYDWHTLEAVILARFRTGPRHNKIWCGEYELLDSDTGQLVTRDSDFEGLVPGASITMAIIIGQYAELARCPRLGCPSRDFTRSIRGGKTCDRCFAWFSKTDNVLRGPRRRDDSIIRKNTREDTMPHNASTAGQDRKKFKNIRLSLTELPPTPRQSFIESRARKPLSGNAIVKTLRRIRQHLPTIHKKLELGQLPSVYKSFCTKIKKEEPRHLQQRESNSLRTLKTDLEPRPAALQEYNPITSKTSALAHSSPSGKIPSINKKPESTKPIENNPKSAVRNQETLSLAFSYIAKNYTCRASAVHQPKRNTRHMMKELYGRPQSDWSTPQTYNTHRTFIRPIASIPTQYNTADFFGTNSLYRTHYNPFDISKIVKNKDNTKIITALPTTFLNTYTANQKLIWAARSGLTSLAKELLQTSNNIEIDINFASPVHGCTALHWAALKGHVEVVKVLLENGADADLEAGFYYGGLKAVDFAVLGGQVQVVRVLKGCGKVKKGYDGN